MGPSTSKARVFPQVSSSGPSLTDIASVLSSQSPKPPRVIVLAGAGLSVPAGLPDFRSPGTGLYSNLERFNLPYPEAVFDIDFFKRSPGPFFTLAKELYPGNYCPTLSHCFIKLLEEKGCLKRCWTQNIDCLEHRTGLDADKIIEAHGSFATATCLRCGHLYQADDIKETVMQGQVVYCTQKKCQGKKDALVKSDIVFFGEGLPDKFFTSLGDFKDCDLLIVTGTSLTVSPFNMLIARPSRDCPRLLVNLEMVGEDLPEAFDVKGKRRGGKEYARDVAYLGDCDAGFRQLARLCGWEDDLYEIVNRVRKEHGLEPVYRETEEESTEVVEPPAKESAETGAKERAETATEEIADRLKRTQLEDQGKESEASEDVRVKDPSKESETKL